MFVPVGFPRLEQPPVNDEGLNGREGGSLRDHLLKQPDSRTPPRKHPELRDPNPDSAETREKQQQPSQLPVPGNHRPSFVSKLFRLLFPMAGKSSDVQIQIQIQIRSNLQIQIQIQICSFKKAKSTLSKKFKSNPNPANLAKVIKSGFKSKSGFGFAHH